MPKSKDTIKPTGSTSSISVTPVASPIPNFDFASLYPRSFDLKSMEKALNEITRKNRDNVINDLLDDEKNEET